MRKSPRRRRSHAATFDRPLGRARRHQSVDREIYLPGRLRSVAVGGAAADREIRPARHRYRDPAPAGPTLYPVACSPQAWAAGTPFLLLQASLGLEFDPDRNEILLRKPRLPPFLEEVTLFNLRLGQSVVDLMLHRDRKST